jgi:hypothetical protein
VHVNLPSCNGCNYMTLQDHSMSYNGEFPGEIQDVMVHYMNITDVLHVSRIFITCPLHAVTCFHEHVIGM